MTWVNACHHSTIGCRGGVQQTAWALQIIFWVRSGLSRRVSSHPSLDGAALISRDQPKFIGGPEL